MEWEGPALVRAEVLCALTPHDSWEATPSSAHLQMKRQRLREVREPRFHSGSAPSGGLPPSLGPAQRVAMGEREGT